MDKFELAARHYWASRCRAAPDLEDFFNQFTAEEVDDAKRALIYIYDQQPYKQPYMDIIFAWMRASNYGYERKPDEDQTGNS